MPYRKPRAHVHPQVPYTVHAGHVPQLTDYSYYVMQCEVPRRLLTERAGASMKSCVRAMPGQRSGGQRTRAAASAVMLRPLVAHLPWSGGQRTRAPAARRASIETHLKSLLGAGGLVCSDKIASHPPLPTAAYCRPLPPTWPSDSFCPPASRVPLGSAPSLLPPDVRKLGVASDRSAPGDLDRLKRTLAEEGGAAAPPPPAAAVPLAVLPRSANHEDGRCVMAAGVVRFVTIGEKSESCV